MYIQKQLDSQAVQNERIVAEHMMRNVQLFEALLQFLLCIATPLSIILLGGTPSANRGRQDSNGQTERENDREG